MAIFSVFWTAAAIFLSSSSSISGVVAAIVPRIVTEVWKNCFQECFQKLYNVGKSVLLPKGITLGEALCK
jgi:hypothetical protein